jgi:hypothetical protein
MEKKVPRPCCNRAIRIASLSVQNPSVPHSSITLMTEVPRVVISRIAKPVFVFTLDALIAYLGMME